MRPIEARTVTRLSRGGPSAAAFSSCRRALAVQWVHSLRWELNSVFWIRSTPLARVVRKWSMTWGEPCYGIEP